MEKMDLSTLKQSLNKWHAIWTKISSNTRKKFILNNPLSKKCLKKIQRARIKTKSSKRQIVKMQSTAI